MNEPYIVVHTVLYSTAGLHDDAQGEKWIIGGRESGEKARDEGGKESMRGTRGPKQGERDSKAITKGLEKAFHPKTVTTRANIHSSIFLSASLLHTNTVSTHTHGQTSPFITHSHTYSELSSNKCTLD